MAGFRRLLLLVVALLAAGVAATTAAAQQPLPAAFAEFELTPGGGSVWRGVIPGAERASFVYLPPSYTPSQRYPVVYLLHGMPGSPWSYVDSLSLGSLADALINGHEARPFVAVVPVAGPTGHYNGEWAGQWEDYLVRDVVPWVDASLSTVRDPSGQVLAGLSAGGFGAVDIGLRHPLLFGRLESWGGYFEPIADGPLRGADARVLAAHDPALLVRHEAPLLRTAGVRVFLSSGSGHGKVQPIDTIRFARQLHKLGIGYTLERFSGPGGSWEQQLAAGLRWALAPG
jgi:enterochelin esterase-like enzyme